MSTTTGEADALRLLGTVPYGRIATSMRALPLVVPAHHVVADGAVLVRIHRGPGHHRACHGAVVAYAADTFPTGADTLWSAQVVGTARILEPDERVRALFGPAPHRVDGAAFDPVHLRIEPRFGTVHSLDGTAK
ncbi:pyridoxamine 5'-phosphate oxidase family protein [Streptomyces coeruleoprunus]|uniref:Pyridoxamine 5'-phosphate oxidase family protein n=1 Tax=Streptomyces coeruleoprunus TaxID=285563 RepID=A0ABV9XB85_9ACTN